MLVESEPVHEDQVPVERGVWLRILTVKSSVTEEADGLGQRRSRCVQTGRRDFVVAAAVELPFQTFAQLPRLGLHPLHSCPGRVGEADGIRPGPCLVDDLPQGPYQRLLGSSHDGLRSSRPAAAQCRFGGQHRLLQVLWAAQLPAEPANLFNPSGVIGGESGKDLAERLGWPGERLPDLGACVGQIVRAAPGCRLPTMR